MDIKDKFLEFLNNHPGMAKDKPAPKMLYVNLLSPDGALDENIKNLNIPGFTTSYECLNPAIWTNVIRPLYAEKFHGAKGLKKMESVGTYWNHLAAINKYAEFLAEDTNISTEDYDWDDNVVSLYTQDLSYIDTRNLNNPQKVKAIFTDYFENYLKYSTGKDGNKASTYISAMEETITPYLKQVKASINTIYDVSDYSNLEHILQEIALSDSDFAVYLSDGIKGMQDPVYSVTCGLRQYRSFLKLISNITHSFSNIVMPEDTSDYDECSYPDDDLSPVILYGPPGTGKTYRLQHDFLVHFDKRLAFFTTFHQSFSYEEFVEGLKPSLGDSDDVKYNIEQGVFFKACEKAAQLAGYNSLSEAIRATEEDREEKFGNAIDDNKLVLLCIDEINRGNVASIFGDLISLIEPSKRLGNKDELILTLPYSKERFGVPSNLIIVGTMNTADRSIQLLDSALRRRFRFEELPPLLDSITYEPAKNVLRAINKRVRAILNKDSQIGHAYFIDVTNDEETLDVIAKKVIPLLEEYFYNDIDKIRFVLNDYGDQAKFYLEDAETKEAYERYTEVADMDSEEKNFFYLNPIISGIEDKSQNLFTTEDLTAADFLNQIIGE